MHATRRGTTLVEVLMAIFIVSIGLMALLALFPMGLLQMGQAFKDQRAAEAAANGAAQFRAHWRKTWDDYAVAAGQLTQAGKQGFARPEYHFEAGVSAPAFTSSSVTTKFTTPYGESYMPALDKGDYWLQLVTGTNPTYQVVRVGPTRTQTTYDALSDASTSMPGFAVYIDPVGWQAQAASAEQDRVWLAGGAADKATCIPRRTLASYTPAINTGTPAGVALRTDLLRRFVLLDELTYDPNRPGAPDQSSGAVERQISYSTAWLVRRPSNAARGRVNLSVVVYARRSMESPSDETVVAGQFTRETNRATIPYAGPRPAIRRGTWLLEATPSQGTPAGSNDVVNVTSYGPSAANFLRVVDVDDSVAGQLTVEFQGQIPAGPVDVPATNGVTNTRGRFIVLDRVVEVFDRGVIDITSAKRGI